MTEQEQNELICEKLLGWRRSEPYGGTVVWFRSIGAPSVPTPPFETWAEAGLILDAWSKRRVGRCIYQLHNAGNEVHRCTLEWDFDSTVCGGAYAEGKGLTTPLAVRDAALAYLQATASPAQCKGE